MRRTLIKDGVVVNSLILADDAEIISQDDLALRIAAKQDVSKCWVPPDGFIVGPEGGEIGDLWDGESYIKPPEPEPEPPTVQDLLDYLGRKRVEVEEGGIVFNGITVATDREHSQVKLTAAYIKAVNDPSFKITNWKISPGVFIPEIDANTIIAMGDAVTNHIQTCFDIEADLTQKILAEPPIITTYEEIDNADWPTQDI